MKVMAQGVGGVPVSVGVIVRVGVAVAVFVADAVRVGELVIVAVGGVGVVIWQPILLATDSVKFEHPELGTTSCTTKVI